MCPIQYWTLDSGRFHFSRVYLLGNRFLRGALHVRPKSEINDPFALTRGEYVPPAPIVFEYSSGGKPRDLIGTEFPEIDLVSQRVIDVLRSSGFKGWSTYPVIVLSKSGEHIEGYHGFAVTGRCGPIDDSMSRRVLSAPATPAGRPVWALRGLYFDPTTWDGADIFVAEGSALVFLVEDVKRALERASVRNFSFKCATEVERIIVS